MTEPCRDICPDHTGQEERIKSVGGKLTLVIWLLGLLLTGTGTGVVVLYSSIETLTTSLAVMTARFAAIDARCTIIEANVSRMSQRLDRLELEKP